MTLTTQLPTNSGSDRATQWETLQQTYQSQQEAHWQIKLRLQEERLLLQEQRRFLAEYRQRLHEDLLFMRQRRQEQERATATPDEHSFQERFRHQQEAFHTYQQRIQDQMHTLHEGWRTLLRIPDRAERKRAFHWLQVESRRLQQELREQRQLFREQRDTYRLLQLDFQAGREQLRAEQAGRRHRQHERRWQGNGDTW